MWVKVSGFRRGLVANVSGLKLLYIKRLDLFIMTRTEAKIIALSASGQVVEFYDFLIFVLFANVISSNFFAGSLYTRYMYLFAVFAMGYFVRPLGGIIFGHYGDTKGRKRTFLSTILLISLATFCIGLIPNYKTIGLLAPILLIILRILQGCSLGGELPGAISFVYEYMPNDKKTFGTSFILSATNIGFLIASFVCTILHITFNHNQMMDYGWRIPFFLGGISGFIICILRGRMSDTPVFKRLLEHNQILRFPIKNLLKKNLRNCVLGILVYLIPVVAIAFLATLPNLLTSFLHYYPIKYFSTINTLTISLIIACIMLFGYIVDRYKLNIYLFFAISCLCIALLIYPLFFLIHLQSFTLLIVSYAIFGIIFGMVSATELHVLARLFPPTVKYSGLGLVINIAVTLSCAMVPMVSTFLLKTTSDLYSIAYALIIVSVFPTIAGLILFFRPPDTKRLEELDNEIRELYNLALLFEKNSLSLKEELMFKKRLDSFADKVVNDQILFKSNGKGPILYNTPNPDEISKLNIKNIGNLNFEEQKELYQRCKYILTARANDPSTVISKYKSLLQNSSGNKYYTYFYTRLIIKELIAINNNASIKAKDINRAIKQNTPQK